MGVATTHHGVNGADRNIGNGPAWATVNAAFQGRIDKVAICCGALPIGDIVNHYDIGRPCCADFNSDGVIDVFDYLDFIQCFSAGC